MRLSPAGARPLLSLFLLIASAAQISPALRAQNSPPAGTSGPPGASRVPELRFNEFGVWGSYALNSPDIYGSRAHGDFGALGFRYGRILSVSRHRVIEYTFDLLPAEVMHEYSYAPCTIHSGGGTITTHCITGYQTVYGGGIAPFGWKFSFRPQRRLQPFAALVGGLVGSVARLPMDVPGGALFNFTAEWQVGFERFNRSRDRAWIVGYKLEHISDAFRTSVNPGIDLNVIFVGYSFFR